LVTSAVSSAGVWDAGGGTEHGLRLRVPKVRFAVLQGLAQYKPESVAACLSGRVWLHPKYLHQSDSISLTHIRVNGWSPAPRMMDKITGTSFTCLVHNTLSDSFLLHNIRTIGILSPAMLVGRLHSFGKFRRASQNFLEAIMIIKRSSEFPKKPLKLHSPIINILEREGLPSFEEKVLSHPT